MTVTLKLRNNEPLYIEDFWRSGPDSYNGQAASGDSDDWLPAFRRLSLHHLTSRTGADHPLHRTYQRRILLGRSEQTYRVSDTIHLFGAWLEGLTDQVELFFHNGTDGIRVHNPTTAADDGTSEGLPAPFTGYGGQATLKNLILNGTEAPGTRGLIIQRRAFCENVSVTNWGWHGINITADALRTFDPDAYDDPGSSNANFCTLNLCLAQRVGFFPGTHPSWVTPTNPTGQRPFGSGLRIQGGDANIIQTSQFNGRDCARFAIFDSGFLGNVHIVPHCVTCRHTVTQLELDILNGALGTPVPGSLRDRELLEFDTFGATLGNFASFAYAMTNANSRGLLICPYVEGASVAPVLDTRGQNFVISGIGAVETATTRRFNPNRSAGAYQWEHIDAQDNTITSVLNAGSGVVMQVATPESGGQPFRLKYNSFVDNTPGAPGSDHRGFLRMDVANANTQVAFLVSGQRAQAPDGRTVADGTLAAGRMCFPLGYMASSSMLPVAYGTRAALPDLTVEATADFYPIGSEYIVTDPLISDNSDRYRCVFDDNAAFDKAWRAF